MFPLNPVRKIVRAAVMVVVSALDIAAAPAQGIGPDQLRIATLQDDGKAVIPGDLLRTTRIFPNWNLNCEVQLSRGRHLCAVEQRSVDARGRQVFAWSIALSTAGNPLIVLKTPGDIDQAYGLRMVIGPFTTLLTPKAEDCTPAECRIVAPFEVGLRTLMVAQDKITFSLVHEGVTLNIDAPLAGMAEALDMARRDPVGVLAIQRQSSPSSQRTNPLPARKAQKILSDVRQDSIVR